ncbi:MAG: squalene--hopene cyclase [Planctomycetota bacterium]
MLIARVAELWADPRLIYAVAIVGVVLLAITVWLFRRSRREGRAAGAICLVLAIALHAALIYLVPYKTPEGGGRTTSERDDESGVTELTFSAFDPELEIEDVSGETLATMEPLPVDELDEMLEQMPELPSTEETQASAEIVTGPDSQTDQPEIQTEQLAAVVPSSMNQSESTPQIEQLDASLDAALADLLDANLEAPSPELQASAEMPPASESSQASDPVSEREMPRNDNPTTTISQASSAPPPTTSDASPSTVPGAETDDFANRRGAAKTIALRETGGDFTTEAAVKAALRFLADAQRRDGAWDPRASGAGQERMPLGERRLGAGTKCTTGITGLSLLAMMGAGNTHLEGEHAETVFRGLAYLIQTQNPDGSLSGDATVYSASYCHSMAALAMSESAVMTEDASALESAKRAIVFTRRMQHPVTGGWRYTRGDPGDLSQLGWQAMVLDAGKRAGIEVPQKSFTGVERFLRSVRVGRGGRACYRPGEAVSRTMTAESLATRLLLGQRVPQSEMEDATSYLLEQPPGVGQDNYYYWYYATLALHQLQGPAWERWNKALKDRLIATQRPDGSWPADSTWGGYGGTIYTTSMAALCLETYYRHSRRQDAVATGGGNAFRR